MNLGIQGNSNFTCCIFVDGPVITLLAKVSAAPSSEASICLTGAFAESMQPHQFLFAGRDSGPMRQAFLLFDIGFKYEIFANALENSK